MTYHKINHKDISFLKDLAGEHNVFTGDSIESKFSHDELLTAQRYPEVHVYVSEKHTISKLMRYANQHKIPVTVRGSGTGLVGACVPIYGGILLDTSKMNAIIELDKTNMTLTVQPGVLLHSIYQEVEKEGLFYAPDPGQKFATIGGNISTNAGGMRAIKYGVTRDWVRGLEIVMPDGDIIKTGGKVVKNSTGFAIKDLMIGSEGTLGIIVEVILKLIPLPKFKVSLLVPFENRLDAIHAAPILIKKHVTPTACEYLEKQSLQYSEAFLGTQISHNNFEAYLLLTYDGNNEKSLLEDIDIAKNICIHELNAVDVFKVDTEEKRNNIWNVRDAFLSSIKASSDEIDECDVVLPRSNIAEFLNYTKTVSDQLSIRIPYFGHIGDGNLHVYLCKDGLDSVVWSEKLKKGFELLYDKAFSLGGLVSGEHGIGLAKKAYMEKQVGPKQMDLMRGIKGVFDPNYILNPGKVI
jgi:glycolate oxidase